MGNCGCGRSWWLGSRIIEGLERWLAWHDALCLRPPVSTSTPPSHKSLPPAQTTASPAYLVCPVFRCTSHVVHSPSPPCRTKRNSQLIRLLEFRRSTSKIHHHCLLQCSRHVSSHVPNTCTSPTSCFWLTAPKSRRSVDELALRAVGKRYGTEHMAHYSKPGFTENRRLPDQDIEHEPSAMSAVVLARPLPVAS